VQIRFNWVSSLMAVCILWGFSIACIVSDEAEADFKLGKSWVTQNFTWLYIGTQDAWCLFLIYLAFSRFANIKLGADDEKPRYNDFTWFSMLFTCGVAVGLYVFGVQEPLYFYRIRSDYLGYSSIPDKTNVDNDAQRAQQAIFMAVYHWGIHGWVPYILLALLIGVVSFRWGMPMTIRSCFYPLIGDHALGLVGDFIDALSISTTTFGVCTSLGLGVTQLASGLQFLKNIGCSVKDNCIDAGGTWDITKYGKDNCFCPTGTEGVTALWGDDACTIQDKTVDNCKLEWLKGDDDKMDQALYTIIALVTGVATLSVLSGLDRGIKTLSAVAFTLGAVVFLGILYADNTWYLLNVVVQTTGYYLQWVMQVGFDCDAFQQLGFETGGQGTNYLWGSDGSTSAPAKLAAVGFVDPMASTPDCGTPNPCTTGIISLGLAKALYEGAKSTATTAEVESHNAAARVLQTYRMSETSVATTHELFGKMFDFYGSEEGVPCGSDFNVTKACEIATDKTACAALWAANEGWEKPKFPRCPEAFVGETAAWGSCSAYEQKCGLHKAYYSEHDAHFMDWWTIFYWAWWITWAPFVGFFVAIISRGRTVRQVIFGGFVCPTIFAIFWFSIFGGLAIKMERVAEMALKVKPEAEYASIQCAEHYSGIHPITPESKMLAESGYYLLSCMPYDEQIYYLMMPYVNIKGFLHVVLWLGLVIYFLTSSDSGSMTDDIISASGLSASKIPIWQKVFWCFTEGIVAIALVASSNGGALKTLQRMSIIIGLPFTFVLSFMVPSLYRVLKKELGETDILESMRFNTQLLDLFEGFQPKGGSPCPPLTHIKCILTGLFVPAKGLSDAFKACYPDSKVFVALVATFGQILYICWCALHIVEVEKEGAHTIAWLCFTGFFLLVAFARGELRRKYNIWGFALEDLFCAIMMYPFVLAQMEMQVATDGKGAPTYFASAEEIKAEMSALKESDADALPTTAVVGEKIKS
jgi:choline-glycine betaine transporter